MKYIIIALLLLASCASSNEIPVVTDGSVNVDESTKQEGGQMVALLYSTELIRRNTDYTPPPCVHFVIVHLFADALAICCCVRTAYVLADSFSVPLLPSEKPLRSGRKPTIAEISSSSIHEVKGERISMFVYGLVSTVLKLKNADESFKFLTDVQLPNGLLR